MRKWIVVLALLALSGCGLRPDVFDQASQAATLLDHQGYALTGGGAGALDRVDGSRLEDGAKARITASGVEYFYRLDATSGLAESSPTIISPDTNAGTKRWVLQGIRAASLQLASGAVPTEFSTDGTLGGNSDVAVPTEKAVKTYVDGVGGLTAGLLAGFVDRPTFAFKDTDEAYIGAGRYHHSGTAEQIVYWNSQLTFQFGPGGSNAGSSAIPASGVLYLYIDDSAVVTLGTNVLTAAEFIAVTTAPTYSATKHGWYNGNDRFILAVTTNASNQVLEFWHDGGSLVRYADSVEDRALANLLAYASKETEALTVPNFGANAQAMVLFRHGYNSSSRSAYWAKTGSTVTGGNLISYVTSGSTINMREAAVTVGASQQIDVWGDATGTQLAIYTMGYFLPGGA